MARQERPSAPPRAVWRIKLEALAAGLASGTLATGIFILVFRDDFDADSQLARYSLLVVSVMTLIIVESTYRKNRGVDS